MAEVQGTWTWNWNCLPSWVSELSSWPAGFLSPCILSSSTSSCLLLPIPQTLRNSIPPSCCLWPLLPRLQHPHCRLILFSSLNLCGALCPRGPHRQPLPTAFHKRRACGVSRHKGSASPSNPVLAAEEGSVEPEALYHSPCPCDTEIALLEIFSPWVKHCSLRVHLKITDSSFFLLVTLLLCQALFNLPSNSVKWLKGPAILRVLRRLYPFPGTWAKKATLLRGLTSPTFTSRTAVGSTLISQSLILCMNQLTKGPLSELLSA